MVNVRRSRFCRIVLPAVRILLGGSAAGRRGPGSSCGRRLPVGPRSFAISDGRGSLEAGRRGGGDHAALTAKPGRLGAALSLGEGVVVGRRRPVLEEVEGGQQSLVVGPV